jgi:hypothetical protein
LTAGVILEGRGALLGCTRAIVLGRAPRVEFILKLCEPIVIRIISCRVVQRLMQWHLLHEHKYTVDRGTFFNYAVSSNGARCRRVKAMAGVPSGERVGA